MRTTVILEDDLFRRAKQRAAESGTTLTEIISQALRDSLATPSKRRRTQFKMVTFGRGEPRVHHTPRDFEEVLEQEDGERVRRDRT